MFGSDGFPELVAQWVQHRVVRMDRWQPVLLELLRHDAHQLLHAGLVIRPVAHDLEAVGEIAVSVGEIWFQLQGSTVRLDGVGDVTRVLKRNTVDTSSFPFT